MYRKFFNRRVNNNNVPAKNIKQKKRGFTLIELLVVISIIGLLSSIVLAALNSARKNAQNAAVIQQVRQYINGMNLSANNDGFPNPFYPYGGPSNSTGWPMLCLGKNAGTECDQDNSNWLTKHGGGTGTDWQAQRDFNISTHVAGGNNAPNPSKPVTVNTNAAIFWPPSGSPTPPVYIPGALVLFDTLWSGGLGNPATVSSLKIYYYLQGSNIPCVLVGATGTGLIQVTKCTLQVNF